MAAAKVIDRGLKNIIAEIQKAKGLEAAIGIFQESKNDGESIAEYAAANEFGTDKIPSRPFMATAFDENLNTIEISIKRQYESVLSGKKNAIDAISTIGERHKIRVKNTITNRDFLPKLSPLTVAKKGSTKTLIDTSAMLNSIQVKVRART